MEKLKDFVEWKVFGVCAAIGKKIGVGTDIIRRYFIYLSFFTIGSPVIVYLFVAFWMNIKRYLGSDKKNEFDTISI